MTDAADFERRAAELRQAFDRSFAAPPVTTADTVEDLLLVRITGDPYALRVREIAGIVARRPIVPVPSAAPGLVGLAGVRGAIVPVFALAPLLGYADVSEAPPWLVLAGTPDPVALGFSELEGYVRLPRASLHADETLRGSHRYVREIASLEGGARPVLALALVVASIHGRSGRDPSPQEPM